MKNRSFILVSILLLTIVSYSNIIDGEFQFDDDAVINANNPELIDPFKLFQDNLLNVLSSGARVITNFTFALNYSFGGLNVEGYHVSNILLHLLVTLVLYIFVRNLFKVESVPGSFNARGEILSLLITGIFALHPVQTESVSYIIQRSEILASLFYLLAIYCLIRAVPLRGRRSFVMWLTGMVCFVLGWGAKEVIVTSPVVFIVYALYFLEKKYLKKVFLLVSPFIVVGAVLGVVFISRLQGNIHIGFNIREIGQPDYFFTQLRVMLTYIRLVFFPLNQNLDYDYPIFRNFFEWPVLLSCIFLVIVSGYALFILYRIVARDHKSRIPNPNLRIVAFGIAWFLIILMPTSSMIPLRDVIYEHRLYLAMVGIMLSTIAGIDLLCLRNGLYEIKHAKTILALLSVSVLIALSATTYERNMVWQTKFSLWNDVVAKSPDKSRPHNNLGNCYFLKNDYSSALQHYVTALKIDSENVESYYNAGIALEKLGRRSDAVYYYLSFLEKADRSYLNQIIDVRNRLGMR